MLRSFTVQRVHDFYVKNFGAKRSHIYVSGVFDTKKVQDAIHSAFDNWAAGAPPTSNVPVIPKERRVVLVDRPKSEQSSVWMGLAVPDPSNADWVRMRVTDALLGGSFGSRITANIREDKGYTYSPYSYISVQKKHALWIEAADITTAVTGPAIAEILKEIDRLQTETVPPEELKGVEASLAGRFIIHNSSRMGVISQLESVDHHELDESFLSTYVNKVMTVSGEDVKGTARTFIQPAKLFIVIVGDKKLVEPQLVKLNLSPSS
jgi:predicted Zn-dependent peptidase